LAVNGDETPSTTQQEMSATPRDAGRFAMPGNPAYLGDLGTVGVDDEGEMDDDCLSRVGIAWK